MLDGTDKSAGAVALTWLISSPGAKPAKSTLAISAPIRTMGVMAAIAIGFDGAGSPAVTRGSVEPKPVA
jgi:hypothetical protein